MKCDKCQSERVAELGAKCSDMCSYSLGSNKMWGNYYAPEDMGVGGRDYIEFKWCLDCGKIQGNFPLPPSAIEKNITDEEVIEFYNNHCVAGQTIDYIPLKGRWDISYRAEEISETLGMFMGQFFEHNAERKPTRKFPPADVFLKMFRGGDADLPWDFVKKDLGID